MRGKLLMAIGHIAGVPFEEWLVPLAATGSGIAIALRAAARRLHPRPARLRLNRQGGRRR